MVFTDLTILNGAISRTRLWDTREISERGVRECIWILDQLRNGAEFVLHSPAGNTPFFVSLGPPAWLIDGMREQIEAPERYFCLSEHTDTPPFQINFILPSTSIVQEADRFTLSLLLSLSGTCTQESMEKSMFLFAQEAINHRPILICAQMKNQHDPPLNSAACDFATVFGALLLMEGE